MSVFFYPLIFIAAVLLAEAIHGLWQDRRRQGRSASRKRIRAMTERLEGPKESTGSSILRERRRVAPLLKDLVDRLLLRETLELRIYQAGLGLTPERFLLISAGLAFGGWLVAGVFLRDFMLGLMAVSVGLLPWLHLGRLRTRRGRAFEQQFPDALDLLIRALRAGHSLTMGFTMVGKELPEPIGTEFALVADQVHMGKPMRDALKNLAHRVDSADLPFFVTAVNIQQETGSNLAEVLHNLASIMRDRFKLIGKVRALTSMGRASANLLAAWPAVTVVALYWVNPGYISPLWEHPSGPSLIWISVLMIVVGYILCRKLATIKV